MHCPQLMQFDHPGVHVVMVGAFEQEGIDNFTFEITISQTQIDWLIDDLKSVDRLLTPWVVAMIHTVSPVHPYKRSICTLLTALISLLFDLCMVTSLSVQCNLGTIAFRRTSKRLNVSSSRLRISSMSMV